MLQRPNYLQPAKTNLFASLTGGLGSAQPPRVSIKDDRFTLIQANGERHPMVPPSLTLDVVIVGGNPHASRMYFSEGFEAESGAPPDCFSDNGVSPSEQALRPQSEKCASCKHSAWDHINALGNAVPACSTRKKVAVIVAGAGETVYLLTVPPASLKVWNKYMAHLEGEGVGAPYHVVTRLSIEEKRLKFDPVDWIPETAVSFIERVAASDEPAIVCNVKDRPRQAALPAPQPAEQIAFTPAQPAPAEPPKPRGRPRTRPNETLVGPGPVTAFGVPTGALSEVNALSQVPAAKPPQGNGGSFISGAPTPDALNTSGFGLSQVPAAKPPQGNGGSFISGAPTPNALNTSGFGMSPPEATTNQMEDLLAKAFPGLK